MSAIDANPWAAQAAKIAEAFAAGQTAEATAMLRQLAGALESLTAGNAKRVTPMVEARTIPADQRATELAAVFEQSLTLARLSGNAQRSRIASRLKLPARRVRAYQSVLALFKVRKA